MALEDRENIRADARLFTVSKLMQENLARRWVSRRIDELRACFNHVNSNDLVSQPFFANYSLNLCELEQLRRVLLLHVMNKCYIHATH